MTNRHNLIAYSLTLLAIVILALAGAAVCLWSNANSEVGLARIIGALAFIGAAVAGLTGVIGTFKASNSGALSESTAKQILDKVPPTQEGQEQ